MFLSCIRAAGWKRLSFSAVLHHTVNWLTGPTRAAKTEERQPKECLSFLPAFPSALVSSVPSLHCQASDKGPPGARACGSVTRGHAHTRAHTLLPSGARVMNCGVWTSPYRSGAHVLRCVCPCGVGGMQWEAQSQKIELLAASSLPSLSRWNFRCCWVSCQQVFCKINGGNFFFFKADLFSV